MTFSSAANNPRNLMAGISFAKFTFWLAKKYKMSVKKNKLITSVIRIAITLLPLYFSKNLLNGNSNTAIRNENANGTMIFFPITIMPTSNIIKSKIIQAFT
jgi:hypothetical protein